MALRWIDRAQAVDVFVEFGVGNRESKADIAKAISARWDRSPAPVHLRCDESYSVHAAVARMLGPLLTEGHDEGIFWATDFGWSQAEDREILDALLIRSGPGASLFNAFRFDASDGALLKAFIRISLDFDYDVVIVRPDHQLVVHIDHDQWIDLYCATGALTAEVESCVAHYRHSAAN